MNPSVTTYYWREARNLGDLLSPLLIEHFCEVDVYYTEPMLAQVMGTGSILDMLPTEHWDGVVAGSGKLLEGTELDLTNARVLGLRGPLTLSAMKLKRSDVDGVVLGDPGLLVGELVDVEPDKYPLGCVPHLTDTVLYEKELARSREQHYAEPILIDPCGDLETVLTMIGSCTKLIGSSLHAIIAADAFGVPRRAEPFPAMLTNPHEGGFHKWDDYGLSIGQPIEWGTLQEPSRNVIERMQYSLFDMMMELKGILNGS